jgi:uncharacterized RDD family membrane protein YckC
MTDPYAPPMTPMTLVEVDGPNYACRRRRISAFFLDMFAVLMPVVFLAISIQANQTWAFYFVPVHGLAIALYRFYAHGRNGQTIGKRLLKIRVVRSDGSPLRFPGSARRALLYTLCSLPWVVAKMIALSQISALQFSSLGKAEMRRLEASLMPDWWWLVSSIVAVVIVAELISCAVTARRQSLSDLIADSIVVNVKKPEEAKND